MEQISLLVFYVQIHQKILTSVSQCQDFESARCLGNLSLIGIFPRYSLFSLCWAWAYLFPPHWSADQCIIPCPLPRSPIIHSSILFHCPLIPRIVLAPAIVHPAKRLHPPSKLSETKTLQCFRISSVHCKCFLVCLTLCALKAVRNVNCRHDIIC